jgi:glycolate oxidase FAD binding subunit
VTGSDRTEVLLDAVNGARADAREVTIGGMGSKSFLTTTADSEVRGRLLTTVEHNGIVDYQPSELVITARSGTPLKELKATLAREGQVLAFEPPEFKGLGTIGGAVASGLAGPGRPWRGGVRDAVLGVVMINGLGQRLRFGGQVMKNVAGFDVSRLQAGAYGIFGLILEVSLRVMPAPAAELTRVLEVEPDEALERMRRWARLPLPISATAYESGQLRVRLSGAETAIEDAAGQIGGELEGNGNYWSEIRDHAGGFFKAGSGAGGVACRHVAPAAPHEQGDALLEWNGSRRWSAVDMASEDSVPFGPGYAAALCRDAGGNENVAEYQRRLKTAFDPEGLFNPEICRADIAS